MKKIIFFLDVFFIYFCISICYSAEFLVMAKNNWMINANKTGWTAEQIAEAEKQYIIGDIVQVFEDGKLSNFATAKDINGYKFYVIRVNGMTYNLALKYQEQWNEIIMIDGKETIQIKCRRRYKVRIVDLPASIKNALKNTGVFNTTLTTIKSYIRNKETGLDE